MPVTLNGSGAGTAKLGPLSAREVWYPDNVAISVNGFTKQAQCTVYMGPDTTQSSFRDISTFGSGDNTGACNADTIKVGFYIWAVWTNGDPGKQATVTVTGLKDV
jgi:hypothetical protein